MTTYKLVVSNKEFSDSILRRVTRNDRIQFILSSELCPFDIELATNHPESGVPFDAGSFRKLKWQKPDGSAEQPSRLDYNRYAELELNCAGSFQFRAFMVDAGRSEDAGVLVSSGWFVADPTLTIGNEPIPLNGITCQTVISKLLGKFDDWPDRLRVAELTGYNMIHFTPLQELGYSNSAYCIRDQSRYNPIFGEINAADVKAFINRMESDWQILSMADLVLNHTSTDSPWIRQHPECGYNLVNSPHLRPAFLLDRMLWLFSRDVAQGKYTERGVPAEVATEKHLEIIEKIVRNELLPSLRLEQFYLVHIDDRVREFKELLETHQKSSSFDLSDQPVTLLQDPLYRRLATTIDYEVAYWKFSGCADPVSAFRDQLTAINQAKYHEISSHLKEAVKNFMANVRWRFVDNSGPRYKRVVFPSQPLMWDYFALGFDESEEVSVEKDEVLMNDPRSASLFMAHNGWVMNDDPLRNFAEEGSMVYLRRELIPWGDNVKLRYGKEPNDCPYLWEHMRRYAVEAAEMFHAVRLDNCHSIPVEAAAYFLNEARRVNPNLYIVAELFTGSPETDHVFVNRLGINSLVRESLNAWDPHEQGRLVHRFGGDPVGAFQTVASCSVNLKPAIAHAFFYDQTHDNESAVVKRSQLDALPSAAMVVASCCAIGSNRGFDELVPYHINVVTEKRLYRSVKGVNDDDCLNSLGGIGRQKRHLNRLHTAMARQGFSEIYVHDLSADTVSITRHNPNTRQSLIVVSRCAFKKVASQKALEDSGKPPSMPIEGCVSEIVFEARPKINDDYEYVENEDLVTGLEKQLSFDEQIGLKDISKSRLISVEVDKDSAVGRSVVVFESFPNGSVIVLRAEYNLLVRQSLEQLAQLVSANHVELNKSLDDALAACPLSAFNFLLFRCEAEERADSSGRSGCYSIPNFGSLIYCGLSSLHKLTSEIADRNDLGHPLCDNLRAGNWLMDYLVDRLRSNPSTKLVGDWFATSFLAVKRLPRFLVPSYFGGVVRFAYERIVSNCLGRVLSAGGLAPLRRFNNDFVEQLLLATFQFFGSVKGAELVRSSVVESTVDETLLSYSLSAGLPHFAVGIWRNWGRDTFIALPGLLLSTGRLAEARHLILAYASCVRHGLVPNLLGEGRLARFNARDATWFWLQAIKLYGEVAGRKALVQLLNSAVVRYFPSDDESHGRAEIRPFRSVDEARSAGADVQPLLEIIQEVLQKHASGLQFCEWNAGSQIDEHMKPEGFNNSIGIDWETGFVFGGNRFNCGTWMDKMGSDEWAGNRGRPATPRDGSAIELVALCYSIVSWLADLHGAGVYPYERVDECTFANWAALIEHSFERHFWLADSHYKDALNSSPDGADEQIRPNQCLAMVYAPDLFAAEWAVRALQTVHQHLIGPMGLKTLSPADQNYRGYYSSDSAGDWTTARGFNYHQGPEWLWPVGFYLRAVLIHSRRRAQQMADGMMGEKLSSESLSHVLEILTRHHTHLLHSHWLSLPELTNENGQHCPSSCEAQAWSVGSIVEAVLMAATVIQN